jgi:hypothetical protein
MGHAINPRVVAAVLGVDHPDAGVLWAVGGADVQDDIPGQYALAAARFTRDQGVWAVLWLPGEGATQVEVKQLSVVFPLAQ